MLPLLVPLSFFGAVYLATFLVSAWITASLRLPLHQWDALVAVIVATRVSIAVSDGGRWNLGLAAPPLTAVRELLLGAGFAVVVILLCDVLIMASTDLRHLRGHGFPWGELIVVYLPAALHEELLFRGYPYQKVRTVGRTTAILFTTIVFAALHGGNAGVSPLAMVNLLLAGVLLALAYEVFGRLWFPIGLHMAWNLVSGPILGYNVSGYVSRKTVYEATWQSAPEWLTGGHFGIEASLWMVVVEIAAIAVLIRSSRQA